MNPVIEGVSIVVLNGTKTVGNIFNGINNRACEIIGGIGLVLGTGTMMSLKLNSVEYRVTEALYRAHHVELCSHTPRSNCRLSHYDLLCLLLFLRSILLLLLFSGGGLRYVLVMLSFEHQVEPFHVLFDSGSPVLALSAEISLGLHLLGRCIVGIGETQLD